MFLNQFDLRIPEMSFLFLCDVKKCSNSLFEKMTSSTDTVFGLYVYQKRPINLKFGMPVVQALFYNILYVLLKSLTLRKVI